MTEQQRNHLVRMVKHAEKVRRNMDNLRRTNEPLTKEETAKVLRKWKKKYPISLRENENDQGHL